MNKPKILFIKKKSEVPTLYDEIVTQICTKEHTSKQNFVKERKKSIQKLRVL